MKLDQNRQSQISLRSSQDYENDKPLFAQISKSFSLPQSRKNKLIFVSKSISLVEPLAYSIFQTISASQLSYNQLILLIDFDAEQIQSINEYLSGLLLTKPLDRSISPETRRQSKLTRLNNLTIDKRKACYVKNGLYAVSSQIFLTDLLRGQATVHPGHISKIVVKLTQKVKDYYHYYAWLCTMLKVKQANNDNKWSVPLLFVCNQVHHYAFEEDLKEVYRIFFCDKVVIWPFGRAEIHKKLNKFRQNNAIKQWQHTLSHSEGQRQIQQVLNQIYAFLKKAYGIKYGQKSRQLDDLLFGRVDDQSFVATRGEYTEFQSIKSLLSQLQNVSKVYILNSIARFIEENTCQIWNSNNNEAIQLVDSLVQKLKDSLFWYERTDTYKIDLKALIDSKNGFIGKQQDKYTCSVPIDIKMSLKSDENQKLNELIKIIQDSKLKTYRESVSNEKPQPSRQVVSEQGALLKGQIKEDINSDWQDLEQRIGISLQNEKRMRTILVVCNTKRTQKYLSQALNSYLNEGGYLNHLLTLQAWLQAESVKRQLIIRRIYDKRKVEVTQENTQPESKPELKLKNNETKVILEELLLVEIEKIVQIMLQYELQSSVLSEEFKNAQSSGAIFDINQEEIKLNEKFAEKLIKCKLLIIDRERIRLWVSRRRMGAVVFEGNNQNIKVIVEYFNKNAQIANFYSVLKNTNPQSVIFYSPSTSLLRSLYLYYAQDQPSKYIYPYNSLQNLHIMNYQDSYEAKAVEYEVIREDKAFWEISQKRSQLSQYVQTPFARIKNLAKKDTYDKAIKTLSGKSLLRNQEQNSSFNLGSLDFTQYRRVVIVDTREFKSSLPSYLYHFGFQVIPMFLKTADYVLSDDIAVQKKSVNTKDLQSSLRSQRLDDQLKRMNTTFRHFYLLIEFEEQTDVKKENFGRIDFRKGSKQNSQGRQLRRRLFQLVHKYERVRLLWSTSVNQSCEYFKQLKIDRPEPDLLRFQKSQVEEDIASTQDLPRISEVSSSKQKLNL